jgi:two-component system response regulator GlrR
MRLTAAGYSVNAVESGEQALAQLPLFRPRLIITDLRMSGMDGMTLFTQVHSRNPGLPVLILTAHGTIPDAIEATSRGVFSYLTKPFNSNELLEHVARALKLSGERVTGRADAASEEWRRQIITRSPLMDNLLTQARLIADSDTSVLIQGDSGTGKELLARAIHLASPRATQPFVAINCSAIPESLFESELFGHVKGAFTGAIGNHAGLFERCNAHGALFLDEIGEVSAPVQIKLLHVLQDRVFAPVGGHERKRFSGRVIAATNRPLGALRREGRFRDDFFYRLCSDVIEMPTLRQRIAEAPGELEQLVRLLVKRIAGTEDAELADRVLEALEASVPRDYCWPGNVRELEQAVRRILLTGRYAGDLVDPSPSDEDALLAKLRAGELTASQLLGQYCALLYRRYGTYAEVAKRTGLDPRTSRKYVEGAKSG